MADKSEVEVPIMTTVHYVLEMQRMGTITETTGRAGSFLQATSMALVALGFIAPATDFGPVFFALALCLLSALLVIGFLTFLRCVQLGIEDSRLAQRGEDVLRFYVETAPSLKDRLKIPNSSADPGTAAVGVKMPGQSLLSSAFLIAFVEAALCGVICALVTHLLANSLQTSLIAGTVFAVVSAVSLLRMQRSLWLRAMNI